MKRLIPAILLFIGVTFSAVPSHALVDFKVGGSYWVTNLSSNMTVSNAGVPGTGTNVDLVDDLGMDPDSSFPGGRLTLGFGGHKIRYGFTSLSWEGANTLAIPVDYGNQSFLASANVTSTLDINYHRLAYQYDLVSLLSNKVGFIAELKYFDIDATIDEAATGKSAAESIGAPIPTVGVAAQVGLPFLANISGEITGIYLGTYGNLIDAEAAVNYSPLPLVTLSAGYRIFSLKIEADQNLADFSVSGPFIMVQAGF